MNLLVFLEEFKMILKKLKQDTKHNKLKFIFIYKKNLKLIFYIFYLE